MYLEDFTVGTTYDIPPVTITKEAMTQFAATYDPLPFHLDEDFARGTRYGALIAPGAMSFMAVWGEFVRMNVWNDHMLGGKSTHVEWFAPVYAGDVLIGRAAISNVIRRNEYNGIVEVTLDIHNADGALVMRNVTEAVVQTRGPE